MKDGVAVKQSGSYEGVTECFCGRGEEGRSESCDGQQVEEGCLGFLFDVWFEGESGLKVIG